jgi:hypothetical protein
MADGELHDLERSLIMSAQALILETSFELESLEPIAMADVAVLVPEPFRERVMHACTIMALIDGEASAAELALLEQLAAALELESAAVRDVARLVDAQLGRARIDIVRRSFVGQRVGDYVGRRGFAGIATIARSLLDREHPPTAARYHALGRLPDGTLGRGFHDFIRTNSFAFPGERGGAPEPIVFHDCLHVLAGYGTSALEETQIAAFQAGTMRRDPIFGLLFALAQFHLGVQVTPVTPAERMQVDPASLLRAFLRGTDVNHDMCSEWQPWDDFERSLDELRHAYNIVPRE